MSWHAWEQILSILREIMIPVAAIQGHVTIIVGVAINNN